MRDFSPEEKLLRLIKGKRKGPFGPEELIQPKEAEEPKDTITAESAYKEARSAEKPLKKETPPEQLKPKLAEGNRARLLKDLRLSPILIYTAIIAAALSLLIYLIGLFLSPLDKERQELQDLKALVASVSKTAEEETMKLKELETLPEERLAPEKAKPESGPSFDEYQKLLLQKDIFAAPAEDRKKTSPEGPSLRELVKDLSLVGVVPGDEPQAIIEDKKNRQTLFLKKGDQIEGLEIREIQSGRVILGYEEETVTLSL